MIERICQQCGKHFEVQPSRVEQGKGKFCSKKCYTSSMVGKHLSTKTREAISRALTQSIELVCQYCGKNFSISRPSRAKNGRRKFCSRECFYQYRREQSPSSETRLKISTSLQGRPKTEITRVKLSQARIGKPLSVNHRRRLSEARKLWSNSHQYHHPEEVKQKLSIIKSGRKLSPETRKKLANIGALKWQEPQYVKMMLEARRQRPTKPESYLGDILNRCIPEFQYNGDFSFGITLGGLIPDFVNVDGKKEVIELFGDYFHSESFAKYDWRRSELGKVMVYNSLGYQCLVIWEHELKNLTSEEVVSKIRGFFRRKR